MSTTELIHGDCLELMAAIPDGSVDMVLCDLPYGTTACKWDTVIPFEPLWAQYKRIAKPNAAIVLTASQPFTTALISSNMKDFRYCWVWDKVHAANFANANKAPLKSHEDVVVFCSGKKTYNPQKTLGEKNHSRKTNAPTNSAFMGGGPKQQIQSDVSGLKYPKSIQTFKKHPSQCGFHPTQKPVALMEYLIRTYTNEGETVLDSCFGSGTTGVACVNTGRNFIGIEKDAGYFEIARQRIEAARQPVPQDELFEVAA